MARGAGDAGEAGDGGTGGDPDPGPDPRCASASADSMVGTGTTSDPYLVCLPEHVALVGSVAYSLASHYALGNDVDVSELEPPFATIGEGVVSFSGTLDGRGRSITGLSRTLIEFVETGGEIHDLVFSGTADANDRGTSWGLLTRTNRGNSYARAQSIDSPNAGGLVGFASGTDLVVSTSYAFPVSIAGAGAQGLVGLVETGTVPTISACYFHDSVTGSLGVPLTTSEMTSESSFVGWDFDTVWQMDPSVSPYP